MSFLGSGVYDIFSLWVGAVFLQDPPNPGDDAEDTESPIPRVDDLDSESCDSENEDLSLRKYLLFACGWTFVFCALFI